MVRALTIQYIQNTFNETKPLFNLIFILQKTIREYTDFIYVQKKTDRQTDSQTVKDRHRDSETESKFTIFKLYF